MTMLLPLSIFTLSSDAEAERLDSRGTFTTMTQAGAKAWPIRQAALLVMDGEVVELGFVTRSHIPVATGWHRLRYEQRLELAPISISDLVERIGPQFRSTLRNRLASGGRLPDKTATAVADALGDLDPAAARVLARLRGAPSRLAARLRGEALQAAAQEADAVRLAIDIADIPRTELRGTRPDGEESFLDRLATLRAGEDPIVAYDSMRFLDFDRIDNPSGAVQFSKGSERLTVININRQALEHTTGADLIYVNEMLDSFVLVQYKALRPEKNRDGHTRLVYRPDGQLAAELERMRNIKMSRDDDSLSSYRLDAGCGFLKLCKPVARVDHDPRELVSGMYIPLNYYDRLVASDQVKGPQGGTVLSYDTVRRYLNNDLFVQLVRGAWIGSRGTTSTRLTKIVLNGLEAKRSMTIAALSSGST